MSPKKISRKSELNVHGSTESPFLSTSNEERSEMKQDRDDIVLFKRKTVGREKAIAEVVDESGGPKNSIDTKIEVDNKSKPNKKKADHYH
jgi:hypothetical protein